MRPVGLPGEDYLVGLTLKKGYLVESGFRCNGMIRVILFKRKIVSVHIYPLCCNSIIEGSDVTTTNLMCGAPFVFERSQVVEFGAL